MKILKYNLSKGAAYSLIKGNVLSRERSEYQQAGKTIEVWMHFFKRPFRVHVE